MDEIDSKENLIRLVNQYKNLVFSVCLKLTGDYFTAEDITQETFIAAYNHFSDFDGANEKAWICRIASNKCIDYLRKADNKKVAVTDEIPEALPDGNGTSAGSASPVGASDGPGAMSPERMYESKAVMAAVLDACKKLPEPYSQAAVMNFVKGMSPKDISEKTGIPLKTVQTRIYRARDMLKKYIRKEDLLS